VTPSTRASSDLSRSGREQGHAAGVTQFGPVPRNCIKVAIAPMTYAVFAHEGRVTQIRETYEVIWNDRFPKSGKAPAEAPAFERHNDTFDLRTGNGGLKLWIPIRA
jgi:AraC family transcriptional regulator